MTELTRNQIFLWAIQKYFFFKIFTLVLLDGFIDGFWKFRLFIVKICILIWYFWVFFENYSMRTLSIRGTNFRACSVCSKMWTVFTSTIPAQHTRNELYRTLRIRGSNFIACWACAEMFKSRISRPNRIRFSKISCYRPLGPYGFGFCKKVKKKCHACVPLMF